MKRGVRGPSLVVVEGNEGIQVRSLANTLFADALFAMSGNDMPTANANPPVPSMIGTASNTSVQHIVSDEAAAPSAAASWTARRHRYKPDQ